MRIAPAVELTTLLRRRLDADDGSMIGFYERRSRSYRTESQQHFLARAARLGSDLLADGALPGDRVVVACTSPEAALLAFCGATMVGAVPAMVAARAAFDDASLVVARITGAMALLGESTRVVLQTRDGQPPLALGTDADLLSLVDPAALVPVTGVDQLGPPPPVTPGDLSHVQLTSGSTGEAKGIAVSHASLLANCDALSARLEVVPGDVFVSWLPLYHDMGLVGQALLALVDGVDLHLLSPFDFLADAGAWLRTISEVGGTFTASPTFGYEHALRRVSDDELAGLDLSTWRSACCGAEPVRASVAAAFVDRFSAAGFRPSAFTPCYGLAEATLAVTLPAVADTWRSIRVNRASLAQLGDVTLAPAGAEAGPDDVDAVALGTPVPGLSVRLVDHEGRTVRRPLTCGEIVVEGSSVAAGQLVDDGHLVPFPADGLRTGDIGFVEGDELFVVERVKNVLIRHGENWSGQVLEEALAAGAGIDVDDVLLVDADLVVGTGLTAVIELERRADPTSVLDAVEAGIDRLELPPQTIVVVPRGSLPRTTSGKKQHVAVRELLRCGTLKELARRDLLAAAPPAVAVEEHASDLERGVLAIVAEHVRARGLDVPVVLGSRFVHDLDFDSLALLEAAVAVEDRLGVAVPEAALAELRTVGDLVAVAAEGRDPSAGEGVGAALAALERAVPQTYTTVEEQRGRDLLIDGRWIADFASCNYLGLDLHPDVLAAVPEALRRWGVHPSWTRAVASPAPYGELERGLAALVGAPDTVVFPTVTLLHFGVLPKLAGGDGVVLLDSAGHNSLHEAAALARARGTAVTTFPHGDLAELEAKLQRLADRSTRVVAVDGVYSMSGAYADLHGLLDVAERHDALLYVDDAHGIGVVGSDPTTDRPYGTGGGGIVRHAGLGYERIVYVGGLSKAFSSLAAFVTCRDTAERHAVETASTMVFSGPIPVASLASALAGLAVNEREGDAMRDRLWSLTRRLLDGVRDLGLVTDNTTGFPIVHVVLGGTEAVLAACDVLWEHGVLLTPALFPAAPIDRGGVRFTLTAANTEVQVDRVLQGLAALRPAVARAAAG